jgi:hypothetical protein
MIRYVKGPRPKPTGEEFLALLILLGPLAYVVRWIWLGWLQSVENLAWLRLVLLFCDKSFVAHDLEFVQAVSVTFPQGAAAPE